jgi:hypothetical protein
MCVHDMMLKAIENVTSALYPVLWILLKLGGTLVMIHEDSDEAYCSAII